MISKDTIKIYGTSILADAEFLYLIGLAMLST